MGCWMEIVDADKAMMLLLQSTRVVEDLGKCLNFPAKLFEASITFREWLPEVPLHPHMEFRGFAHKKQLNALTQYMSFVHFPELVPIRKEIETRIREFHDSIRDRIPHSSYVIDFYVTPERVMLIELNPFHIGAGAGLFSWHDDRERFMNGPFEFRILEPCDPQKTEENPLEVMPTRWRKFIIAQRPASLYDYCNVQ
eukprot:TRINITY_DN4572_c0_g1_i1.p1 TRINITY_DN4572_c0_g1~~TRINITY_DN4572_c0_g1_i1.p1  ORF type:complete len:197 (-),score=38.97 TRINITY_DN4572_c0_g1_i1:76-666(-)